MATLMVASLADSATGRWLDAMSEDMSAAQAAVFRLMVTKLKESD
jgi:hypothetical protein